MELKLQKLLDLLHNATSTVLITIMLITPQLFYSVPTPLFLPLNEYLVFH